MAAHDDADIDARQRAIVEIGAHEGLGDEARRRAEARRMVVADEVIVDRLGDMHGAQRIILRPRLVRHDAYDIGGIVAADIEKPANVMRLERAEDRLAIGFVRLVAGRAERGSGRCRHGFQIAWALFRQV